MSDLGNLGLKQTLDYVKQHLMQSGPYFPSATNKSESSDPMLEELANSYLGGKKMDQKTAALFLLKKRQYELMKEYYENQKEYSDPDKWMIAPTVVDVNGTPAMRYGWVNVEDWKNNEFQKAYDLSMGSLDESGRRTKNLMGWYNSPREFAKSQADYHQIPWDDNYLYNRSADEWNTEFERPLPRAALHFGKGLIGEKGAILSEDDILRNRRGGEQLTADYAQDAGQLAVQYGLPAALASAVTGGMSIPAALALAVGGFGLRSLADDAIDYARLPTPPIESLDSLRNGLPSGMTGRDFTGGRGGIIDPGSLGEVTGRAALEGLSGAASLAVPMWMRKHGTNDISNMLKVWANNGDNPIGRKNLIYQQILKDAQTNPAASRYLQKYNITSADKVPDELMNKVDRLFKIGTDTWESMGHELYNEVDAMPGLTGTFRQPNLGRPDVQDVIEANRAAQEAYEAAMDQITPGVSRSGRKRVAEEEAAALAESKNKTLRAVNMLPQLDDPVMGAGSEDLAVRKFLELNPDYFGDIGAKQAEDAAKYLLGFAKSPDTKLNRWFLKGARLPQRPSAKKNVEMIFGTKKNPKATPDFGWLERKVGEVEDVNPITMKEIQRDRSVFTEGGQPHGAGMINAYNPANAKWLLPTGEDVTQKVLDAQEKFAEHQATSSAAKVNARRYTNNMRNGSFDKSKVASREGDGHTLQGEIGRKALTAAKLGVEAGAPLVYGGTSLALRKANPYVLDFMLPEKED